MAALPSADVVLRCLVDACTSLDLDTRKNSEQLITSHLAKPGFPSTLLHIFLDEDTPLVGRHAAGVMLKRVAKEHWGCRSHDDCGDAAPQPQLIDEESKRALREGLPRGLFLSERKLTTMAGVALGEIAVYDFPTAWPTLLTDLVGVLSVDRPPAVVAAVVKCLKIISDELSDDTLLPYCDSAIRCLVGVAAHANTSPEIRRYAFMAVSKVVEFCQSVTDKVNELPPSLQEALPGFIELCASLVGDDTRPILAAPACQFFNLMLYSYSSAVAHALPGVAGSICTTMLRLAASETTSEDNGYSSDGFVFGPTELLIHELTLLKNLLKCKRGRAAVGAKEPERLRQLHCLLLQCCRLTDDDIDTYTQHPGQYVLDETQLEEEGSVNSGRIAARAQAGEVADLLHSSQCYKANSVATLLQVCKEGIEATAQEWKRGEAALYLLVTAIQHPQHLKKVGFDSATVYDMTRRVMQSPNPFLQARCLAVLKSMVDLDEPSKSILGTVPEDILKSIAACACAAQSHIARTAAVKCFIVLSPFAASSKAAVPQVVESVRTVIARGTEDPHMRDGELLVAYIEDIGILCETHKGVEVSSLPHDLVRVWQCFSNNPYVVDAVSEAFGALAKNPSAEPSLHHVVTYLAGFLNTNRTSLHDGLISSSIFIIGRIVKHASPALLRLVVAQCFPVMAALTLMQHATPQIANCIRSIVARVSGAELLSVEVQTPAGQSNALLVALDVAQHTLSPEHNENALVMTGKLVLQLLDAAGQQLGMERVGTLLGLVTDRALAARTTTIFQEMLLPLAALACQHTADVVAFLERDSRLERLLQKWFDQQGEFMGSPAELQLLMAGMTHLCAGLAGAKTFRMKQASARGDGEVVKVTGEVAGFIGVARSYYAYVAKPSGGGLLTDWMDYGDDDDEDDGTDEEDEEQDAGDSEADRADTGIAADDGGYSASESSDGDGEFVADKQLIHRIAGEPDVLVERVQAYLRAKLATVGPASQPFFDKKEAKTLQEKLIDSPN